MSTIDTMITTKVDFHHMRKDGCLNASLSLTDGRVQVGTRLLAKSLDAWAICDVVSFGDDDSFGRGSLVLKIVEFFDGC